MDTQLNFFFSQLCLSFSRGRVFGFGILIISINNACGCRTRTIVHVYLRMRKGIRAEPRFSGTMAIWGRGKIELGRKYFTEIGCQTPPGTEFSSTMKNCKIEEKCAIFYFFSLPFLETRLFQFQSCNSHNVLAVTLFVLIPSQGN